MCTAATHHREIHTMTGQGETWTTIESDPGLPVSRASTVTSLTHVSDLVKQAAVGCRCFHRADTEHGSRRCAGDRTSWMVSQLPSAFAIRNCTPDIVNILCLVDGGAVFT